MADRDLVPKDRQSSNAASPRGTNYLLAIAINDYLHCTTLNNTVKDVEAFIEVMTTRYRLEPQHITFIKDAEATKNRIERAFDSLIDVITEQDNLIIYFSGHGRHHERRGGFWIPVDAGTDDDDWPEYLSNDTIKSYLGKIKSLHTFLIADSCFSGSLFIDKSKEKFSGDRRDTEPSRWGLTSGKKEIVSDGRPGTHSPFAAALLDVLRKADQPPGVMRICDLVLEKVAANNMQTPMGSPLMVPGHQGGQLIFYFRQEDEKAWLELGSNAEGCSIYLTKFPDGRYRALAEELVYKDKERRAWQQAKDTGIKSHILAFERDFPNSPFVLSGELNRLVVSLEEEEMWLEATRSNTIVAYQTYLIHSIQKKHSLEASEALKAISEKELEQLTWEQAKKLNTHAALGAYLQNYPKGRFAAEAERALKQFQGKEIVDRQIALPKEEKATKELVFSKKEDANVKHKENKILSNSKFRWIVSIIGFMLVLVVVNKIAGLISTGGKGEEIKIPYLSHYSLVLVPGGKFQMGSSEGVRDEKPVHEVILSDFYIGKTEITQAQWRSVMGSDPPELNFKDCGQCPVESVSWDDVQVFIKALNGKTGKTYRLPTEAEWEYAARGGASSLGFKHSGGNNLNELAWYRSNSGLKTHPVAQKKANELGLYDMNGNVWEWCQDWYAEDYYAKSLTNNPTGPDTGSDRVFRGGSFNLSTADIRVTFRGVIRPDSRDFGIGFRLAWQQ